MNEHFKVYDIGDEVQERQIITADHKENINSLFRDFMSLPISRRYSLVTDSREEHTLSRLNNSEKSNDQLNSFSEIFATDLYSSETIEDGDGNRRRNRNIKQGILIIRYDAEKVIILKLEEVQTINSEDFSRTSTYGGEKDYYKIAIMPFQDEGELYVNIIDANPRVAKYWSEGFLKLTPTRDSEINTQDLMSLFKDNELIEPLDDVEIPEIEDTFDKYLLNNTRFSFEEYLDFFNNEHNKDYNLEELFKNEAISLIDDSFALDSKVVNKHFRRVFQLNEQIKIDIENIILANQGGKIGYNSENRKIEISVDDDFNVEEEFHELM